MQHATATILTMALYMGICLMLGVLAYRRTTNLGDYILGGRSLGSWVTALSAQATDMSGWLLMGLPGLAYASGLDAAWLVLGLAAGTWLNWRFVAARLRRATEILSNSLTLPDYFERRFDDRSRVLRTVSAAFILVFFVFYTSSGFVAAARLFETLFGLPYVEAMLWGTAVMLAYTFLGGFLAVSWSDVLQGTLMFFALIAVGVLGVSLGGGIGETLGRLRAIDPALLDPLVASGDSALGAVGIVSLLGWGLGYAGQPHILARFMAARSVGHIAVARRVAMGWVIVVLLAAVVVGLAGRVVVAPALAGPDVERVFIVLATTWLPPALAGICLAGVMAAIMSTASAQLLVASSAFAQDFYRAFLRPRAGRLELLWTGRCAVLAISVLAFLLALNPESRVLDLVAWAWAGFGAAFGPALILSLYWQRMTRAGALAGIVVGGATVILWKQGASLGGAFAMYELVPGFALSWLAIWLVSRLSPAGPSTTENGTRTSSATHSVDFHSPWPTPKSSRRIATSPSSRNTRRPPSVTDRSVAGIDTGRDASRIESVPRSSTPSATPARGVALVATNRARGKRSTWNRSGPRRMASRSASRLSTEATSISTVRPTTFGALPPPGPSCSSTAKRWKRPSVRAPACTKTKRSELRAASLV